ncbi:MAG: tetratricopeptide repeat protein [Myxococcales bacterium]|nr:tetratricopeptide repeat protein [Myxococcales bacterium]MCB9706037.1 tetratricopeptide repeat protein [Myxococcales bacterium]
MRRTLLVALFIASAAITTPACKLASRNRVQSIKLMNEGIEFSKKNNSSAAEKALQDAIKADPSHAAAHHALGVIYRKQGKWIDAEKAFLGAIENMKDEPNGKYWYDLGAVQAAQGEADGVTRAEQETKFTAAINSFQEALKLNPRLYKAHFRTGQLYEKLDQPQKADGEYRKTIELKPTFSPAFVELGNMYIDYGHANVAMVILQTGTQVNETDARMWNGLGRAYLSLNQPKEAIDAFTKAKAIDPDMVDALYGLGMAYADLRQRSDAKENLQLFLSKAGGDTPEHIVKAARDTMARMDDVI